MAQHTAPTRTNKSPKREPPPAPAPTAARPSTTSPTPKIESAMPMARGRRADDERRFAGARARETFDEQRLVHAVAESTKREQPEKIAPCWRRTAPDHRDDRERQRGQDGAKRVVTERREDRGAVLDDA